MEPKSPGNLTADTQLRKQAERERLAARLRANLGRRKQQQRAREEAPEDPEKTSQDQT